ncbi:MAG: rubredoxin-like domain-containing protein [Nanoarchaeota archaeon]
MEKRWTCRICGFLFEGPEAPERCLACDASQEEFKEE